MRRSGNGVFCITAPGIDPSQTLDGRRGEREERQRTAIILVGSGLAFSQQCTGTEFQVITMEPLNFNVGRNDVSFEFIIP